MIETSLAGLSVLRRSLKSFLLPSFSVMVVSEKKNEKKLYEGVVEIFAHYTLSDLTLETRLTVAGISLPTVVLTFVSQSGLSSS